MQKAQFYILYRNFLRRLFAVEMLSTRARGEAGTLLGQLATLLLCLALLFALPALSFLFFDVHVPPPLFLLNTWGAQHFLIATTMVVVGLFAVLHWNNTFPGGRDVLVLAPLPVRSRAVLTAKMAAVGTALAVAVLALHSLAGAVWPFLFNHKMSAQSVPEFRYDRAIAPVGAADMKAVLDRDILPMLQKGGLAPGTGGGVAIGVYKRGVRRVMTYGTASPDSVFEIGSISKTFTGLLLAKMTEQKKVALDQPVRLLLPPETVSKPRGEEIRLLDLVTHRSGLPSMPSNLPPGDPAYQYSHYHTPDLYAYLSSHGVLRRSDASFTYSNLGFALLSQALANRAGRSYSALLRQEITVSLGLRDTVVRLSSEQQRRLIQGHNEQHEAVPPWNLDDFAGAGGIRSTAGDILTYLIVNLHPEKLASTDPALAAALSESHKIRAAADPNTQIALAWFYNPGTGVYFHSGVTGGYTSYAFFHPQDDYAAIVLLNNGPSFSSDCGTLGEHIRQRLAGEPAISLGSLKVPARGGFSGFVRSFFAYWISMFLAGTFMFCCVLGLQGLAAQLPRRYFLRVSPFLQFAVLCALLGIYFLQPSAGLPALIRAQGDGLLSWSPSFWFLGLYQQLSGSPALASLAYKAWAGLAASVCGATLAYTLSCFHSFRRIAEEPDLLPGSRGVWRLPPFGGPLQTALVQFSMRTLLRSRQHRLLLAFYAGIAFAVTSFLLKSPAARKLFEVSALDPRRQVNTPLLASTVLIMVFAVVGLRIVFSLPMDLGANWIFRVTPIASPSQYLGAYRRSLWVLAVIPVWLGSAALLLPVWPWQAVLGHLAILGLLGTALVEFCLPGNGKIPFTCSWLPGRSNFHITFILCLNLVLLTGVSAANLERKALQSSLYTGVTIALLAAVAAFARWRNWLAARSPRLLLQFDESSSWQAVASNLPNDGGLPAP